MDDGRLKRFFRAFGRCIQSFSSTLRPMVVVDGSYLRRKYPGVLLMAITLDANNNHFPIAFSFVEAERPTVGSGSSRTYHF